MDNRNTCLKCGCKFYPSRSDQLYCSDRCRYEFGKTGGPLILPIKKKWFDF